MKRIAERGAHASGKSGGAGLVQSLGRGLSLLDSLAECPDSHSPQQPLSAARLVALDGAPTADHPCCDPKTRYWSIGVQACIVGSAFVKARDLLEIARPRTRGLVEESGETINLAVLDGSEAVFLEQVECRQMMRAVARPGVRIPFHCSGVGKAFLATLPETEVAQILRKHGLPRLTPRTLTTLARLREDIERTRKRGSASMTRSTRWACAASLQSSSTSIASPVGAVSVSGPAVHIPDERIANPRDLVRKTALAVT